MRILALAKARSAGLARSRVAMISALACVACLAEIARPPPVLTSLLNDDGRSAVLGEDRVDIGDKPRNEASVFGAAPPGSAAHRFEQAAQVRSGRQFESPL